ncbi:YaaA family protein [Nitrosophilus alvini]|uniref:YaaA family protein n=1 Tax=Nitrosophilus alvini TaxID=2714855 RepID=UPI00190DD5E2|nr:YaaA family protein [Nitrosophilus alvini]
MKILFSPSESKSCKSQFSAYDKNSFFLPDLFDKRVYLLNLYRKYVNKASSEELQKLFGLKKESDIQKYTKDIATLPTAKAVERYNGIAYEYLDYSSLDKASQRYLDNNLIIFSNLFGPILAKDKIPRYKLKQGSKIGNTAPEAYYKKNFSKTLEEYLKNEPILDLRAGFYEKFYALNQPYITMKFLKNGKTVSHWAKAYRGIVLREVAKNRIETQRDLLALHIEGLVVKEIIETKNCMKIIYSIS